MLPLLPWQLSSLASCLIFVASVEYVLVRDPVSTQVHIISALTYSSFLAHSLLQSSTQSYKNQNSPKINKKKKEKKEITKTRLLLSFHSFSVISFLSFRFLRSALIAIFHVVRAQTDAVLIFYFSIYQL